MIDSSAIARMIDSVPSGVWVAVVAANLVVTIVTWGVARRRLRAAGERARHPERFVERSGKRDVALTVAALIPAALFWGMVLAGSFHGLVAFGRNVLGWNDGSEYLVPGTLDGVSVTFGFLAFRAVHKHRDPTRGQRVVWVASLASAMVNFAYEYGYTHHNLVAGGYTGLLSLFGVTIFHEFLAQFEDGAEYVRHRKRPPWGLRWLTAPASTFRAAVAWENSPPAAGTPATVLDALANVERVRQLKRATSETHAMERHHDALARARRRTELASLAITAATNTEHDLELPGCPDLERAAATIEPPMVRPAADTRPTPTRRAARRRSGRPVEYAVARPPAHAATVAEWAGLWVRMCADGHLVHGPLNDDAYARAVYRVSSRKLRSIRAAATSGGLAQRATELDIALPPGFASNPTPPVDERVYETAA